MTRPAAPAPARPVPDIPAAGPVLRRAAAAVLALALLGGAAAAQATPQPEGDLASLVADSLRVEGPSTLIAEGRVEMLYRGYRLLARRVVYDRDRESVRIEGPLVLTQGPDQIIVADEAELSDDLREGVIRSARLVMDRRLQIAANEIARAQGRYTRMTRAAASSCEVCAGGTPLWEIRARRVTHDAETRQLYFEGAQFRMAGLPLAYLPRLRIPDASVDRYQGFLLPAFSSSSNLGSGVSLPWFQPLGDQADVTLSPFVSSKGAELLEARYRQAFAGGWIDLTGAVARDELGGEDPGARLYAFGDGAFALPRGAALTFGLQVTSDSDYLSDYDISDDDRLRSFASLARARRDELVALDLDLYQTLREGEDNDTIGSAVASGLWRNRLAPGGRIGGQAEWSLASRAYRRGSRDPLDGPDLDTVADGRDLQAVSLAGDWRRDWRLEQGVIAGLQGNLRGDAFWIAQDAAADPGLTRVVPTIATGLRWPLVRRGAGGAAEILEPMAQLAWSPEGLKSPLNEDGALAEFDEANLFALSRFPGSDAYEQGLRLNLGASWTRFDPAGHALGITLGRVLRAGGAGQFAPSTGLEGARSDWLAAVRFDWDRGVSLANRAVFDDAFRFARNELRAEWDRDRLDLASGYVWIGEDPQETRALSTSEWKLNASYDLSDRWTATTMWRYDFTADRAVRTELGVVWRNECLEVDATVSRRTRNWESDEQTTSFNLQVELLGFGRSGDRPHLRRQCAG